MNKIILIGNVCNEPEAHTTQSGISQSTFRIAVTRRFANSQGVRESDFFTVIAWRQQADFVNQYIHKGYKVAVEGSVQNRSYEAKDGTKRYVTEIMADSVDNLTSRSDAQTLQQNVSKDQNVAPQNQQNNGFTEVDDDLADLPF